MALRVTVVSDSHLSARTPAAVANWRAVADHVAAEAPDVVVHAGDVTADAAVRPDDLAVAATELARIGPPLLALPGNHDVGDNPHAGFVAPGSPGHPAVSRDALDRFREAIGPDRWSEDRGAWRLVGLDAQLFGSGLADEAEQWDWLADALAPAAGARHVALFLHKPVGPPPGVPDDSPWRYLVPSAAARLRRLVSAGPVRVVVSGHVHQYRTHALGGVPQVWAPTTWAVIPDRLQASIGEKACGVVDLTLGDNGDARAELRRPPGVARHAVGDDIPDPYEATPDARAD